MAEYIEREALIEHIYQRMVNNEHKDEKARAIHRQEHRNLAHAVRTYPAADVVEVRHGEWVDNGDRDRNGLPKPFAISCSVCGSSAGTSWMKYCPNCGAKMDGKGEGEKSLLFADMEEIIDGTDL